MMRLRRLFFSLGLILSVASCLLGQASPPIFPLRDVTPGLKGVGRTVFEGDRIDEFQVEILGVLKNAVAPRRDLILARLSGGPLGTTGVVSGMSGSPVYVDGKLVGAVSRAFPLSKGAIAGVTPIEQMLSVVPSPPASVAERSLDRGYTIVNAWAGSGNLARLILDEGADPEDVPAAPSPDTASLPALLLPLRWGGFSGSAVDRFAPQLRRLGLEPMQGGVIAGSGQNTPPAPTDLQPGSMISLLLVRGDLNLNIDCTVTLRQGNSLYACGHQVLAAGPAEIPFAPAHVIVTVPSIASSFKVDAPGAIAGTIQQDRFDAIYGKVGKKIPPMIPVHVNLKSSLDRKSEYDFEIIKEPFLSPLLLNLASTSVLTTTERSIGAATLNIQAVITLAGGRSVRVEDVLSGEAGTVNMAGAVIATPLAMLMSSGFSDLNVQAIDLNVESLTARSNATLEDVWSTQSEVRPGDHLEVTALLRLPNGTNLAEKIPVAIPASVTDKMLQLVVGGGSNINAMELRFSALGGTPHDSQQLVEALNRMRRNNRVYALLMTPQRSFAMQGSNYPSPPPSLLQTLMADPAASNMILSGTSLVGDFETKPTPYAIHGQKTLLLKVADSDVQ